MLFTITDKKNVLGKIGVRIGPDYNSASSSAVSGVTGRLYSGSCRLITGGTSVPLLSYEYPPLPWFTEVTDEDLTREIKEKDKGYWGPSIIEATMKVALENGQLRWLIEESCKNSLEAGVKAGQESVRSSLRELIGVQHNLSKELK